MRRSERIQNLKKKNMDKNPNPIGTLQDPLHVQDMEMDATENNEGHHLTPVDPTVVNVEETTTREPQQQLNLEGDTEEHMNGQQDISTSNEDHEEPKQQDIGLRDRYNALVLLLEQRDEDSKQLQKFIDEQREAINRHQEDKEREREELLREHMNAYKELQSPQRAFE